MRFADTHSHILDSKFDGIREEIVSEFVDYGVDFIIENGTCVNDSLAAAELSAKHKNVFCAVGIHPENCDSVDSDDIANLENILKSNDKIVAIGEIGLDYHYGSENKKKQIGLFERQIAIAERYCLPVIVHSRDAAQDTFDIISRSKVKGSLHCFSGSLDFAKMYIELGFFIGIGGTITFKNARKNIEVLDGIPLECILTETDCPYLSPEPFRGCVNSPLYIPYIIRKIAEIKNTADDNVAEITLKNAKSLFSIGD